MFFLLLQTYFFCDTFFFFWKSLNGFAMPGVLTNYWIGLLFRGSLPVLLSSLLVDSVFTDGLSVLILEELAESLISALAIALASGFAFIGIASACIWGGGGGFPFESSMGLEVFLDDSCFEAHRFAAILTNSYIPAQFLSWSDPDIVACILCR